MDIWASVCVQCDRRNPEIKDHEVNILVTFFALKEKHEFFLGEEIVFV